MPSRQGWCSAHSGSEAHRRIISSAWSGLDPDQTRFVLDDWGVTYTGQDPCDPAFIIFGPELAAGMPDMRRVPVLDAVLAFPAQPRQFTDQLHGLRILDAQSHGSLVL